MLPLALLVAMGTLWGLQFAMLKLAVSGGYSEITVAAAALLMLAAAFAALAAAAGLKFQLDGRVLLFFFVASVLGYLVPLLITLVAASGLSAGMLVMIGSLTPLFAAVTALVWRTEPVSGSRLAAIGLGLLSILIMTYSGITAQAAGGVGLIILALAIPCAYGIESVYISTRWPMGLSPLHVVTGETVISAIIILPVWILFGGDMPERISWSAAEIAILVFVAAGVLESLIYFYLIRVTGGVFVNFATFVALFSGIAWGALLFGERPPAVVWIAALVLAAALAVANRSARPTDSGRS